MQATDFENLHDPTRLGELDGPDVRRILVEREMRASPVIVGEVSGQDPAQVPFAKDDDMIETLAPDRADEPLREGVLPRAVRCREDFLDPHALHSVAKLLFWVVLSRLWKSWRNSLQLVRPETVVGWHRQGFRRYWAWKSRRRRGRPAIRTELRDLIRRISRANPLWGAPRIHGELLKLGLTLSQATVSKYMLRPRRPPSQAWRTFLKNHAQDLIALDFFTVPTATFRVLFVLVVLSHDRRRLVHFNVTEHPTAGWTARQLVEACGLEETPGHLIRDRDQVYGERFSRQARAMNFREAVIAPRSLWQNAYAERVIGSIRPECLDHVVVIGERHLKRLLLEGTGWRIRPTMRLPLPTGRLR